MESLTIITGCARSGTSLVAGIASLCGAFGGDVCGPTLANKKGQFENNEIRNSLTKPFLKRHGYDPMGQHPLPDIEHIKSVVTDEVAEKRRQDLLNIFKRQGHRGGPFYFKEAKACLIWPLWAKAFPKANWIIVRRSDEDIINSCLKTGFMRAHTDAAGWQRWVDHHKERFEEMKGFAHEVWPKDIIAGDLNGVREVVKSVGLTWDEGAVRDFVEPKLWNQR